MMDLDPDPEHCGMYRAGVDHLKIPQGVKSSDLFQYLPADLLGGGVNFVKGGNKTYSA